MLDVKGLDIYVSKGDTEDLLIEFEDEIPPDNTNVIIALKKYPNNNPPLWEKSAIVEDGVFHLRFRSSDTNFSPGVYNWDMTLLYDNGEIYHPMNPAKFQILGVVSGYVPVDDSTQEPFVGTNITGSDQCICKRMKISIRHSMSPGSVTVNEPVVDNSTGIVLATATIVAGYVDGGTEQNTLQLPVQPETTITPTRNEQTAIASGYFATGNIKVAAIPNEYYLLTEVYPVGSLYATENTSNPAIILGFGTWMKIAPANATWGQLYNSTWNIQSSSIDGLYVYRRIA